MRNLIKKYQIRPLKRLGQNFLIDKGAIKKIIRAANLGPKDIVLEIGPGLGALTQELAKKAKRVIAVEKDRRMVEILKETLKDFKNIEIIQGDILKIFNSQFSIFNYKIVGNLPFYLTAPVIRKFLEDEKPPKVMVLVVQKEVGQRIVTQPPDMNLLAVSVQFYAKPEIVSYISKKSFWPQPKVDSAIIKIVSRQLRKHSEALRRERSSLRLRVPVSRQFRERFFRIVRAGFSQPRKQLINNLSKGLKIERERVKSWLLKNNIQPTQRAETLNIQEWISLVKSLI